MAKDPKTLLTHMGVSVFEGTPMVVVLLVSLYQPKGDTLKNTHTHMKRSASPLVVRFGGVEGKRRQLDVKSDLLTLRKQRHPFGVP